MALTVATSGIHPTTSRLVAVAAVLYDAEGRVVTFTGNRPACADATDSADTAGGTGVTAGTSTGDEATGGVELTGVVQQINPGDDPGPWHLHGYTEAELGQAPGFATVAPLLSTLVDGRTLICHHTSLTWGFIVQEYRRAQRAANRSAQQNGNRGRRRNQRRNRRFAVPVPERIVDTLGTARRQSVPVTDSRLRGIAAYYRDHADLDLGPETLPDLGAVASETRAGTGADELLLADTRILMPLHLAQEDLADAGRGVIQSAAPEELTADRFGLQRSTVRVDATTAPRPFDNPGVPASTGVGSLTEGMEFVVSPDVATDPDTIIAAGLRAGLVYSEKLNRASSLVVCNRSHELRGKAMHAHRKNIPLFTDREFLDALAEVGEGSESTGEPELRPATPRIPAPQRGGRGRTRQTGKQGGRQGSKQNAKQGGRRQATKGQPPTADSKREGTSEDNSSTGTNSGSGSGSGRNRSRNRNRRRSPRSQSTRTSKQQGQGQPQSGKQNATASNENSGGAGAGRSRSRRRRRSGTNRGADGAPQSGKQST